MSGRLESKVAVITGGSTGIGFATAKRFVTEGASVFLTGRREPELNRAAEMLGPHAVPVLADSSNLDDLDRLYELIRRGAGRIDILSAGLLIRTRSPARRCSSHPMTPASSPARSRSPMAGKRESKHRHGKQADVSTERGCVTRTRRNVRPTDHGDKR